MSLLFYRRPDYLARGGPLLTNAACASYRKQAESRKTPPGLSFLEIVQNRTLPPCSLNDFMDYLLYIEHNAECLQFFLWYRDYVERWSCLPQDQRELSPVWDMSWKVRRPASAYSRTSNWGQKTSRVNGVSQTLEGEANSPRVDTSLANFSWPQTVPGGSATTDEEASTVSLQPFRDELQRIVLHYISNSGPRQLNLTHADRVSCTEAAEYTTHPSALFPAFAATEAVLKGQCHPNFVRWSISNSSRARVVFVRGFSAALMVLGFALDALLVLSKLPPSLRLVLAPLWCLGLTLLIAARHGICVILHWSYKRNLRPWEQFADEDFAARPCSPAVDAHAAPWAWKLVGYRSKSSRATLAAVDPMHKPSLQSLGAANTFDSEPWVGMYHRKPVWARVLEVSITTQNEELRMLQDCIVLRAVLAGCFGASVLAVASVFVPSPGYF